MSILFFLIFTELKCYNMTNLREEIMVRETWEDQSKLDLIMQCMKHDINSADTSGETILMKLSRENHTEMIRVLSGSILKIKYHPLAATQYRGDTSDSSSIV